MPRTRASTSVASASRFLDVALKKAGPLSLCYVHAHLKWVIRDHILSLVQDHPTLTPRADPFTYDDGSTAHLLNVSGVLPLKELTGSLPFPPGIHITVWLHWRYPIEPPSVSVSIPPAAAARVPQLALAHPFVDPTTGIVTTPYLQNWGDPRSGSSIPNLSQLAHNLIKIFTYWPPFTWIISRPPAAPAAAAPLQQQPPRVSSIGDHSQEADADSNTAPAAAPGYQQDNNTRKKITKAPISSMASPREAADRLSMALLHHLSLLTAAVQEDVRGFVAAQARLNDRAAAYDLATSIYNEDFHQVCQDVQQVNAHVTKLVEWLNQMDPSRFPELAPEGVFLPNDDESSWRLEERSGFDAIDDIIHKLDKAVEAKIVPVMTYLPHVRALAKEQSAFIQREAVKMLFPEGLPRPGLATQQPLFRTNTA